MNTARFVMSTALVAALLAPHAAATEDPAAALFDSQTVHEIRLYMNSRDLRDLRTRYLENVYYTADMQWRGIRARNVGVRVRGGASRSATKPGLRVDFDRYVTGQRFLGLRALVFDNLWQDASMLREALSMSMFERLGHPASREAFGRLYINNVYHGLYAIVEAVEPEFLTRTVGENTGYLFEYHRLGRYFGEDLGDDYAAYRSRFEPRTRRLEADAILYGPIRNLFREANYPFGTVWRDRVGRYLDLDSFVTQIAIEACISEYDGVLGFNGMNNFYLYRPAESTVHRFIPWDKDLAFEYIDYPILGVEENPLSRGALAFPDLRARYLEVLGRCARAALDHDWLAGEVRRLSLLIRPAAHADTLKPFSNEEFDKAILWLEKFAAERPGFVLDAVAAIGSRVPE